MLKLFVIRPLVVEIVIKVMGKGIFVLLVTKFCYNAGAKRRVRYNACKFLYGLPCSGQVSFRILSI